MTTLATTLSLREALTPEALTRARRRLLTAHPDPTRANTPHAGKPHRRAAPPPRRERLGAATDRRSRCEHDRNGGRYHSGAPG